MIKKDLKNKVLVLAIGTALAGSLAGCGQAAETPASTVNNEVGETDTNSESGTEADTSGEAGAETGDNGEAFDGEVQQISVGIGNAFNPFCYLDSDGNLQGFDYEVIKEVDERLPQYEFVYDATEFSNILVGLDTGKYRIAVHHYGWNAERAENYLYADVANWTGTGYVIAAAPGQDFKDVDDLQGHTSRVSASSNTAFLLEKYNSLLEDGEEEIELIYDEATSEQIWSNIANGVYDSYILDEFSFDQINNSFNGILDKYGSNLLTDLEDYGTRHGTYFIYNYGDEGLKEAIDEVLDEIIQDGTLAQISLDQFGVDYITGDIDKLYLSE